MGLSPTALWKSPLVGGWGEKKNLFFFFSLDGASLSFFRPHKCGGREKTPGQVRKIFNSFPSSLFAVATSAASVQAAHNKQKSRAQCTRLFWYARRDSNYNLEPKCILKTTYCAQSRVQHYTLYMIKHD